MGTLEFGGVTAIDCNTGATTVNPVDPWMPFNVAEIVETPIPAAVAKPLALMVATAVAEDAQLTWLVRFCIELSLKVPVAVNC